MQITDFIKTINTDFFAGVPDSLLSSLADYLMEKYGEDPSHHVIAANEGNAAAMAAGYHLATGKVAAVYMQNSGQGNAINPLASLLHEKVYGIPAIFIIGWRGEPGEPDEPQHAFQGEVTISLMREMEVPSFVVTTETEVSELGKVMEGFRRFLDAGRQVALIIEKGALINPQKRQYGSDGGILREDILKHIVQAAGSDPIVSTTGKTSRELFEIRKSLGLGHERDFLTVGSMGHASSIAMAIAAHKPETRVWCIDGDGAAIMHMGSIAVIAKYAPKNLNHIVINNSSHESVGGLPTAGDTLDLCAVAHACGYPLALKVTDPEMIPDALEHLSISKILSFMEITSSQGSRPDLGRPTTSPVENKRAFMEYLGSLS